MDDGKVYEWDRRMDGWVDGRVDGWMGRWGEDVVQGTNDIDGQEAGQTDDSMVGYMELQGRMDEWMDGQTGGWDERDKDKDE